jgi:hypothetical protein
MLTDEELESLYQKEFADCQTVIVKFDGKMFCLENERKRKMKSE